MNKNHLYFHIILLHINHILFIFCLIIKNFYQVPNSFQYIILCFLKYVCSNCPNKMYYHLKMLSKNCEKFLIMKNTDFHIKKTPQ